MRSSLRNAWCRNALHGSRHDPRTGGAARRPCAGCDRSLGAGDAPRRTRDGRSPRGQPHRRPRGVAVAGSRGPGRPRPSRRVLTLPPSSPARRRGRSRGSRRAGAGHGAAVHRRATTSRWRRWARRARAEAAAHAQRRPRLCRGVPHLLCRAARRQRQRDRPTHPRDAGSADHLSAAPDDTAGAARLGSCARRRCCAASSPRCRMANSCPSGCRAFVCCVRRDSPCEVRTDRLPIAPTPSLGGDRALLRPQGGAYRRDHLGPQPAHASRAAACGRPGP